LIEPPLTRRPLSGFLREKIRQWQEGQAALSESRRDLEDIARMVSHNLQEPLRKITVFGDRLRRLGDPLDDRSQECIDRMVQSAHHMRRVFEDLTLFSSMSTHEPGDEVVLFERVVNDVLIDLEEAIAMHDCQVSVTWQDDDPGRFRGRGSRLLIHRLLANLITNGMQFHKEGEPPVVHLGFSVCPGESGVIEIAVRDEGIGFDEKYGDRIFQPFQQVADGELSEGTGMGLALVRKIAERHGGSVSARGLPGRGALFRARLPILIVPEEGHAGR